MTYMINQRLYLPSQIIYEAEPVMVGGDRYYPVITRESHGAYWAQIVRAHPPDGEYPVYEGCHRTMSRAVQANDDALTRIMRGADNARADTH